MILSRNWLIISTINLISFVICLQILILNDHNHDVPNVYGQSLTSLSDNVYQASNSSFNAEGSINTILSLQNSSNNSEAINRDINTNSSSKYLLGGKWRIDVSKDNLTYFKSNFTMIEVDGRSIHYHTIVYKPVSKSSDRDIQERSGVLYKNNSNNSTGFKCSVDVYTNGVLEWKDIPITVSLMNKKIIVMDINDKKTSEHFLKNPIYGLINSIDLLHQ